MMAPPPFPLRRRPLLIAAWAVAILVLVPRAAHLERSLEVGVRVAGSESAAVEAELASGFGSPYAQFALLVVRDAPPPTTPDGRRYLESLAARVRRTSGVTAVRGFQGPADSLLIGKDGRTSILVVGLDGVHGSPDTIVPRLREATTGVPGATLHWTGQAVLNADLRRLSADDARNAERRVLPLSLVLLIVAFGTLVAALVPVLAGALTILLALGTAAVLTAWWPLSIALQNVVTMIGLGLGIDYALLAVSRFREGLAAGRSPRDAAADMVRHAGPTIAVSGLAVAVGFAGLLAIPVNELRSVAIGGLVTVTFAALLALTLLPVCLAWMGTAVNRGVLPLTRPSTDHGRRWLRWGRCVVRRPIVVLVTAGLPVVALAWQARRLQVGEPTSDWLPPRMESAAALHELEHAGRSGLLQTIRVILDLPAGDGVTTTPGWRAAHRTQQRLAAFPGVALVRSIASPDGARPLSRLMFFTTPDSTLRTLVSHDRQAALFDVVPREGADPSTLAALVDSVRALDMTAVTGLRGARVRVGGLPAFRVDYVRTVGGALPIVVLVIVLGTLVSLAWAFRSVLVPLKAVILNLLSVAAGFGAVVLVFQDGHGIEWFGLTGPVDQIFVGVPALVFCAVFGLSMDYEVFLVSRVAESRRRGLEETEAIAEGLARTGPVITNAAAIMVVVFGAFTLGQFLMMRMLGLALAVTALVDATLVRAAIGPALLALAGRWNWWPGDRQVSHARSAMSPVVESRS